MKIALCLSGQPRYLEDGYMQIYENILSKYSVDTFIHTWWDYSYVNKKMIGSDQSRIYFWKEDTIKLIEKYYSPINFLHEPQINFQTYLDVNYELLTPMNVHSMLYSIEKSNNLKMKYEKENNFVYDCVIRTRFDYLFTSQYDLSKYDLKYLHIKDDCSHTEYAINDHVAFSNSQVMDIYSNMYDWLETCYNEGIEFNTEVIWGYYLNKKKHLPIAKTLGGHDASYMSTSKERWKFWGMSPTHKILDI